MKGEIWKPVVGYENLYEVSNMGRVKSLGNGKSNNSKERILKAYGDGYLQVKLHKEGKVEQPLVHVLVATAFLDNVDNLPEVNHKDENPKNNCVENLEWCSSKYNTNYGTRNKRISEKMTNNPKISKPVFSVNKETGLIMWWQSSHEAERCTGINNGSIINCCKGRQKSAGGHIWFYADDDDNNE